MYINTYLSLHHLTYYLNLKFFLRTAVFQSLLYISYLFFEQVEYGHRELARMEKETIKASQLEHSRSDGKGSRGRRGSLPGENQEPVQSIAQWLTSQQQPGPRGRADQGDMNSYLANEIEDELPVGIDSLRASSERGYNSANTQDMHVLLG